MEPEAVAEPPPLGDARGEAVPLTVEEGERRADAEALTVFDVPSEHAKPLPPVHAVPLLHIARAVTNAPEASMAPAVGHVQRRPAPYQERPPSHSAEGGAQARLLGLHVSPTSHKFADTPWQESWLGRHTRPVAHSVAATGSAAPWAAVNPARAASQLPQLGAAVMPRLAALPR